MTSPDEDSAQAARHAEAAEEILDQAGALPEQLALQMFTEAATRSALAVYYELRARP